MTASAKTANFIYKEYQLDTLPEEVKRQLIILFLGGQPTEKSTHRHRSMRSDSELDMLLSDRPKLHENMAPEVSDEDFKAMVKNMHNKPQRNIEKWL